MSYANATRNLQTAALSGDTKKLQELLISMPASAITKADKSGRNAIHLAASSGNASSIDVLLKAGGNALKLDNMGCSPMHFAAESASQESVVLLAEAFKVLIRKADNEGNEPIHFAAEKGNHLTCLALLNVGAKVQARNKLGTTPLLLASMGGFGDVVHCLLENGAQCDTRDNSQRRTPLLEASAGAHERVVEQLIAAGAAPTHSCLLLASRHERGSKTIKCLLKNSDTQSFLAMISSSSGKNALHVAAEHGYAGNLSELLSVASSDTLSVIMNQKDNTGMTPLQSALLNGNETSALALLRRGARTTNLISNDGVPLLHSITSRTITAPVFLAVLTRFRDETGNIDELDSERRSALTCAILHDRFDLVRILTAFGADINGGPGGINPLITATQRNAPGAVKILIAVDAVNKTLERNAVDTNGETALMIAENEGLTEIAELIAGPKDLEDPEPIVMMDCSTQVQIWEPLLQTNRHIENSARTGLSHICESVSDQDSECSNSSTGMHHADCQVDFPPLPPERQEQADGPANEENEDELLSDTADSCNISTNDGGVFAAMEPTTESTIIAMDNVPQNNFEPATIIKDQDVSLPCQEEFESYSSADSKPVDKGDTKVQSRTNYLSLKFARFICLDSGPSVNEFDES